MSHPKCFFLSLTRIADFESRPFDVEPVRRPRWATGDYVMGEITARHGSQSQLELISGRMIEGMPGDRVIGALGTRCATLEGVGSWEEVGDDLSMHSLTAAGLLGKATSISHRSPQPVPLDYVGHVCRGGAALNMLDFTQPTAPRKLATPVVLLVGSSMSAGKTTAGRVVIHELKRMGRSVVGAKLTGAGRFRDVLTFGDAGADHILDFVDAGIPSTAAPPEEFRKRLRHLLSQIAALDADVLVAEAGASPLEPYNGAVAIEELGENVCCRILCASDPYAAVGVRIAFGFEPDLVTGPAANTDAGIELVTKLTGVRALDIMDRASHGELAGMLARKLNDFRAE
jgi:hypothetical protein